MDRESKRKLKITLMGILGMIMLIVGTSFAVFSTSLNGTKTQNMSTGCLKIEMSDEGALNLTGAYPVTDEEGLKSEPYTYTIKNTCTVDAYYDTTINIMNGSTLANAGKIKVALDGDSYVAPTIENTLEDGELLDEEVTGVLHTYKLDEGYLKAGEEKEFKLRTWIDYNVEDISGKLENKIIINSEASNGSAIVYNTNTIGYFSSRTSNILKKVNYSEIASSNGIVQNKKETGTVYNYRGNPNNYVTYGTTSTGEPIRWRVLGTNTDGSVNLITENTIGTATYDNASTLLNSFYTTNLADEEDYINKASTFCVEGETNGEYLAKIRTEKHNPTTACNGTTVTKIGLPTVDELMYAGAVYNTASNTYLDGETSFITSSKASGTTAYALTSNGIKEISTSQSTGVKAVITLKANTMLLGSGTSSSSFYVTGTYSNPTVDKTDSTKPEILYARVDEAWSKTNKSISISAKDNKKITGYYVSNTNTAPSASSSGWEASTSAKYTTVNTFDNGTYYVFTKDAAGNVSNGEKVVIARVDKVLPICDITVTSSPDDTKIKTLTINSTDTNIDLKGYSWEDSDSTSSVRKVNANGTYTGYIKDLAGNKGSCSITVTSITPNTDYVAVGWHTTTANANGGSITSTEGWTGTGSTATKDVIYNHTYGTLPTLATRSGYTFKEWNTKDDGTGTTVTSSTTMGSSTTTIYAIWKKNITVTATNQEKVYDGTALSADTTCSVTTGTLSTGDTVTCTSTGSQTNVGNSTKTLSTVTIEDSSNNDVTENYQITKVDGTLEVTPKELTITAYSTSYSENSYTRSIETGVGSESVTLTYTPYENTPGVYQYATSSAANKFTLSQSNTNYTFTEAGDFTINPVVNLTVNNGTITGDTSKAVTYNGTTTFTVTPSAGYTAIGVTPVCTNSQTASLSGTTVTTGNVTNNTTCTITFVRVTASDIYYDNTTSGVNCSTAQCMIDNIMGRLS